MIRMSKYLNKVYNGYRVSRAKPTTGSHTLFVLKNIKTGKKVTVRDNFMTKLSRREVKVSDAF